MSSSSFSVGDEKILLDFIFFVLVLSYPHHFGYDDTLSVWGKSEEFFCACQSQTGMQTFGL